MHMLLLCNPVSGGGTSVRTAEGLVEPLRAAGHEPRLVHTQRGPTATWLAPLLAGVELLVVVGGDGTVRLAAPEAAAAGVPVYQFPSGTENLFARGWGMNRRIATLLRTLAHGKRVAVDLGAARVVAADGTEQAREAFLLMASVGLDAEVVHDLSSTRGHRISHLSYLRPMLRQVLSYVPARLRVEVDGRRIDGGGAAGARGFAIVANARQYALRLDPLPMASMTSGMLETAFFPTESVSDLLGWATHLMLGTHLDEHDLRHASGRSVVLSSETPFRFQVDGDAPANPTPTCRLELGLEPHRMPVLAPPQRRAAQTERSAPSTLSSQPDPMRG
ncbi:MAG: NAD(+)/NADH kinase [Phycisphaerales bacterium]|nr:NAD(+)/NADH kinase [Phycisphaerales bacterium]